MTDEWQTAGDAGNLVVRRALAKHGLRHARAGKSPHLLLATGLGGLAAVAEFLVEMTKPEGQTALERWALGYVRGVIRGAEGPVHDDGRPMDQMPDA